MAGGPASHACRRGSGSTRGFNFFVLGGSFTRSGVDGTRGLGVGGLIRCAGRPREWSCGAVSPQERWHEGGWFLFFLWRLLRCRRGILSHALEHPFGAVTPLERRDPALRRGRRGLMRFLVLWGAVVVCSEGRCGGGGRSGPLAREIPDVFRHGWRRAGKFRNDGYPENISPKSAEKRYNSFPSWTFESPLMAAKRG